SDEGSVAGPQVVPASGRGEEVLDVLVGDEPAPVQGHDPGAVLREPRGLMGADERGRTLLCPLTHMGEDTGDGVGVQPGGGLVQDHQVGVTGDRPGDLGATQFAAGEGLGLPVDVPGQPHQVAQHVDPLSGDATSQAGAQFEPQGDVLPDGEGPVDDGALRAPSDPMGRHGAAHTAPGGSDQFRGHVEQGGLAGTVESDDRHHLAGTEGEGDVVEGRDRGLPVVLADLVDLQHQAATALSNRSATSTGIDPVSWNTFLQAVFDPIEVWCRVPRVARATPTAYGREVPS